MASGRLAQEITEFENSYEVVNRHYPCLAPNTRQYVLNQIFEDYKKFLISYTEKPGFSEKIKVAAQKSVSILDRAIIGKTTLEKEVTKAKPANKWPKINPPLELTFLVGTFDMMPAAQTIDKTIRELYAERNKSYYKPMRKS